MIEAALEALTAAVVRNNELLEQAIAGRAEVLATAQALQSGGAEPAKRTRRAATDASTTAGASTTAAANPPKEDYSGDAGIAKVRAAFGAYLGVDDAALRGERATVVKKILAKFGVAKATEVPEANRAQAVEWVNILGKGGTVPELADEQEEESLI